MIAVLLPVLGRPHRAAEVYESIVEADTVGCRPIFLVSPGDVEQEAACRATGADVEVVAWSPGRGDYARKINAGFRISGEDFVFTGADDLEFERGWDTNALDLLYKAEGGVCGTQDAANPLVKRGRHSTHSLVDRSYVEVCGATFDSTGEVLHEGYDHQYVDTELVRVAQDRDCWTFAATAVVRHLHPFYSRDVKTDETYAKALRAGRHDKRIYDNRLAAWQRS